MNKRVEQYLQKKIFPGLENGRPNWDKPHTICVVEKLKQILMNNKHLELDEDVLIISAYAHDWGYAGLFKEGIKLNLNQVNDAKEEHAIQGKIKIEKLLHEKIFDYLSDSQKTRIAYLVFMHDRVGELNDIDELILMEADTLGGLDVSYVKPTFDKFSNDKYLEGVKSKRLPKFITEYSKKMAKILIEDRIDFYRRI